MAPLLNSDSSPPSLDSHAQDSSDPIALKIPLVASPEAQKRFGWPEQNDAGYRIKEEPMGTKRKLKVVVLGAGVSGINFTKTAQEKLSNVEIVCYEKNDEIGGTWYENVYVNYFSAELYFVVGTRTES